MKSELNKTFQILMQGGIILYPTDTVWGIGCDATNYEAVKKIYELKRREDLKSMICLVNDVKMLNRYIERIPEIAYDIIEHSNKPTTIVYDNPLHFVENLIANDNTIGIRIISEGFCADLLKKLKKPLVSTSANISGQPTPKSFKEISNEILKGVDYIVDLPDEKNYAQPSSIIKINNDGTVKVIRE
jgi:L-threonylcarbamoyladenylate synthase